MYKQRHRNALNPFLNRRKPVTLMVRVNKTLNHHTINNIFPTMKGRRLAERISNITDIKGVFPTYRGRWLCVSDCEKDFPLYAKELPFVYNLVKRWNRRNGNQRHIFLFTLLQNTKYIYMSVVYSRQHKLFSRVLQALNGLYSFFFWMLHLFELLLCANTTNTYVKGSLGFRLQIREQ